MIPALKWAWEHDHNQKDAYPVKILEICSNYNQKTSVYDSFDQSTGGKFDKNEYVGLMCECLEKESIDKGSS